MLPSFANDTVQRLRPGSKVERGSTVPDWSAPDTLTITGCSMQPAASTLSQDGRVLGVTDNYTCYLPPGADVRAGDRIRFGNLDYTIQGDPREWPSPTGRVSHIMLSLTRWWG